MVIEAIQSDGSEQLIGCSDIRVLKDGDRIQIEICNNGKPFRVLYIPEHCEVVYVLADAKGSKGEKVRTISLRQNQPREMEAA